jgi:hypothetical protein
VQQVQEQQQHVQLQSGQQPLTQAGSDCRGHSLHPKIKLLTPGQVVEVEGLVAAVVHLVRVVDPDEGECTSFELQSRKKKDCICSQAKMGMIY